MTTEARAKRRRCWDKLACARECPVPSVDNFGNPYPGCARWRLKSQAEIDAALEKAGRHE